jgi:hypothetical protein
LHDSDPLCQALWQTKLDMRSQAVAENIASWENFRDTWQGKKAYDLYEPDWNCHIQTRVGRRHGDGGKFVCGNASYFQAKPCLVYSVGSNGDFSFEIDVKLRYGCEIHTFDPTGNTSLYRSLAKQAGVEFHSLGLSGTHGQMNNSVTNVTSPLLPFPDIAELLGHHQRHIDILKVDCEGCEYGAFPRVLEGIQQGKYTVGQIQIELHGTNPGQLRHFFDACDSNDFFMFHKERNHWGCDGYRCIEFSFINKETAHMIHNATHCGDS